MLDGVHAPHCLDAHVDHGGVPRLSARHRAVRAVLLLGRRSPRLQGSVGRRRGLAVHVRVPRDRQRGLLAATQRQAQDAGRRVVRRHGRVADRHHHVHENVRERQPASFRFPTDRRLRRLHVLRPGGRDAVALDAVQRSVPENRHRYLYNNIHTRIYNTRCYKKKFKKTLFFKSSCWEYLIRYFSNKMFKTLL